MKASKLKQIRLKSEISSMSLGNMGNLELGIKADLTFLSFIKGRDENNKQCYT